jgi:hypothetical protein
MKNPLQTLHTAYRSFVNRSRRALSEFFFNILRKILNDAILYEFRGDSVLYDITHDMFESRNFQRLLDRELNYKTKDLVSDAIGDGEFTDAMEEVIQDHDFSDEMEQAIRDFIEDYDFSEIVEEETAGLFYKIRELEKKIEALEKITTDEIDRQVRSSLQRIFIQAIGQDRQGGNQ